MLQIGAMFENGDRAATSPEGKRFLGRRGVARSKAVRSCSRVVSSIPIPRRESAEYAE